MSAFLRDSWNKRTGTNLSASLYVADLPEINQVRTNFYTFHMKMPITSNIRQTMNKQISKGMLKDIQNIARKKKIF